ERPLLGAAFQQGSAIESDRLLQGGGVALRDGGVEGEEVALGGREAQAQSTEGWGGDAGSLGTEGAAEVLEAGAEVGESAGLGVVRPEGAGEPGAFDGGVGPEGEEGEEPGAFAGAEARQRLAVHLHLERAEEANRE